MVFVYYTVTYQELVLSLTNRTVRPSPASQEIQNLFRIFIIIFYLTSSPAVLIRLKMTNPIFLSLVLQLLETE